MKIDSSQAPPLLSVIIPARDEEDELPHCVNSIRMAARELDGDIEIIVVDNGSQDQTKEFAGRLGCRVVECAESNLSVIRNRGIRAARASWIVTIDADSRMNSRALRSISQALKDQRVVGGASPILPMRISPGIIVTGIALIMLALYYRASAGMFFFRRDAFESIGGFDESLVSAEDIDFACRLRKFGELRGQGFKVLWDSSIVTSVRKFDRFGDWYFFLHPIRTLKMLRGTNRKEADRYWYKVERLTEKKERK